MPPKRPRPAKRSAKSPARASGPKRKKRPPRKRKAASPADPRGLRLQKVMAAAGVASRRDCEELISSGRVDVDGKTVTELGTRVLPGQEIKIDGTALKQGKPVYYAINKPTGVVSTNHDPSGRARVIDLLPPSSERLFCVGRLDRASEGLIIITNDGDFAQRVAHPKFGVEKTYRVQVAGKVNREVIEQLKRGIHLAEAYAQVDQVRIHKVQKQSTWLEMVLSEGKNREIRRIMARVGHKVMTLKRIAIGSLRLKQLTPGEHRVMTKTEINGLLAEAKPTARKRRPRTPVVEPEVVISAPGKATGAIIADDVVIDGERVSTKPKSPRAKRPPATAAKRKPAARKRTPRKQPRKRR